MEKKYIIDAGDLDRIAGEERIKSVVSDMVYSTLGNLFCYGLIAFCLIMIGFFCGVYFMSGLK